MTGREEVRPLSVLHGRDCEAIPLLLSIHAVDSPEILDVTHNRGVMWKGLPRPSITMDIDPSYNTDIVGSFTDIPLPAGRVDVIVFDPTHLPVAAASKNSSMIFRDRYGITNAGAGREGDNISGMFLPFLLEAQRVLRPDGIILAKIADIVHNHRFQWHHVDFVNEVKMIGMTACDHLIKIDPAAGRLMSSKWKNVKHLRKAHCHWIVARNSSRCERKSK